MRTRTKQELITFGTKGAVSMLARCGGGDPVRRTHMKARILILAGTLLLAPAALADDHHFQAITSGALTFDIELGAAVNKADHVLPDSPGQASPFTGNHQCTPA